MAIKRYSTAADLSPRSDGRGLLLVSEVTVNSSPPSEGTWTDWLEFRPNVPFSLSIWGTYDGVVTLERSFDGGVTGRIVFQATDETVEKVVDTYESGTLWRVGVRQGDRTSGTMNARISQSP